MRKFGRVKSDDSPEDDDSVDPYVDGVGLIPIPMSSSIEERERQVITEEVGPSLVYEDDMVLLMLLWSDIALAGGMT